MSSYLSLVRITASTVGKVILCSAAGMFISRYLSHREHSEKGFTYISVRILLPLLLFSNLCLSVTWESLRLYYWAPLIATIPIIIGISGACVCRIFLNSTYSGMLILGCSFQNGLTFPVSLVMNLKGIQWFGPKELEVSLDHIFLYNIVCSIGLWVIGEPVIEHFKAMEVVEETAALEELRRQRLMEREETRELPDGGALFPFSDACKASSRVSGERAAATTFQQFAWYRPADPLDVPIQSAELSRPLVDAESDVEAETESRGIAAAASASACSLVLKMFEAIKSPTVAGSICAIVISLVPPLRWVAETMPGEILLSGFALIGSGAIPLQLLVLGATVVQSKPAEADDGGEGGAVEPQSWKERLTSQQSLFVISSITIRLVIVPAVCFGIIHLLSVHHIMPDNRIFLLSMLVATCSPSAINSSIICVIHDYHAKAYSQMIFIMYVSAIFFTTVWLFLYVLYLD